MNVISINKCSDKWEDTRYSIIDFHLSRLREVSESTYDEAILLSAPLLNYKKIGSMIYDIILDIHDSEIDNSRILDKIQILTTTVSVFDAVVELRNIIDSSYQYGSKLVTTLLKTSLLVVHSYGFGNLFGINSKERVVLFSDIVSPYDMYLAFYLSISKRPKVMVRLTPRLKPLDGNKRKFESHLKKVGSQLLEELKKISDKDLISLFNNMSSVVYFSGTESFFNELDDSFSPSTIYLDSSTWEREDFGQAKSAVAAFFSLVIKNMLKPTAIKERNFYIREKGVRIVFPNPIDNISSIEVREFHGDSEYDEHYINIHYTLDNELSRNIHLNMKDISTVLTFMLFEKDASVIMILLKWMGILDEVDLSTGNIKKVLEGDGGSVDAVSLLSIARDLKAWFKYFDRVIDGNNYYYETPTQWNYESEGYSKTKPNNHLAKDRKSERIITIGRYTRKLPVGQYASETAKELANKYFMDLKEGYTLVDEFQRKTK